MPVRLPVPRQPQEGIALPIVIVLVLVSALLVLWGFRASVLNEAVVGNDADYQRAYEAAQALMQDAELDIGGLRADGHPCVQDPEDGDICRRTTPVWFIDEEHLLTGLINTLGLTRTKCQQGICIKRTGVQDFWKDRSALDAMLQDGVGARYGQFTGATHAQGSHPILSRRAAGEGGWYWVEILPYEKASPGGAGGVIADGSRDKLALTLQPSLVYRITAIARGLKPHTQVVLQSTYVRQATAD